MSELVLSAEEITKLKMMARRPKSDQRTAFRAVVALDCGSGLSNAAVAAKHKVTAQTVGNGASGLWRSGSADLAMPPGPDSRAPLPTVKLRRWSAARWKRSRRMRPIGAPGPWRKPVA